VVAMMACARLRLRVLEALAPWLLAGAGLLLLSVVVAGHVSNGATRWLRVGLFTLQPTDLARLATVVFLAWHSATPVGIAVCFVGFSTFLARPLINIHDLAVIPVYRRHGVGRLLLEQVAAKGKALGCCKLTLEVRADNHSAQRLYEAVGFDNAASYGGAVRVLFLEKRL